jgi:hypothetical protein
VPRQADWISYSELLADRLDGSRAKSHVEALAPFYRSPGSSGYDAAIDYIVGALTHLGVSPETRSFQLDGRTPVLGEVAPRAWEPRGGSLEVVSPQPERLVTWDECPSCLAWWCPPTPEEGVDLPLVDVGTGERDEDFQVRDVAGKAVLVHDAKENFAWFDIVSRAARFGAKGVVSNYLLYQYEPWRTRDSVPDAVQQLRLSSRGDDNPWTFTISQPAFERVLELLASAGDGEVVLRFCVDAETYEGKSRYVVARVPAQGVEEAGLAFVAHVTAATKPGANCASGVGLMIELAGAIQGLYRDGLVGEAARPIYFVFGNEGLCSTHWFETSPEARSLLATLSFCSVGHDQAKTRSSLVIARSPDSLPTFMNDLVESLMEEAPKEAGWAYREGSREISLVHWSVLPYTPWSDNATWAKLGVPALLFMSLPDRYFHTQLLTPDKTDPVVFERCGQVTGAAALTAATIRWPGAADLLDELARRTLMRLSAASTRVGRISEDDVGEESARLLAEIEWILERDGRALRSVLALIGGSDAHRRDATKRIERIEANLRLVADIVSAPILSAARKRDTPRANGAEQIFKRRTRTVPHGIPGMSYGEMRAAAREMAEVDSGVGPETMQILADEVWNLSTGEWTVAEVTRILEHEFDLKLRTDDVLRLAEGLREAEYVELTQRSRSEEES